MDYLNCILFILGIINLLLIVKKKLLLYFLFQSVFIVLVSGQAVWFSFEIYNKNNYNYLIGYNTFSIDSAFIASLLFTAFQIIFILLTTFTKRAECKNIISNNIKLKTGVEKLIYLPILLIVPVLMIQNAGGPSEFFLNPGAMIPGQTFLLIILGILKWNLLSRIIYGSNITKFSFFIFLIYIVITLFTSRFLTIFAFLQLILAVNYYKKGVSFKLIFLTFSIIFIILLVYGLYRDVVFKNADIELFSHDFLVLYINRFSNVIEWFYILNSEVYFGLSGAIDKLQNNDDLTYLIPEINSIFLLIPNSLRINSEVIQITSTYLATFGNASDSVVSSGFERFYLGLGILGFIIYSFIILFFLMLSEKNLGYRKVNFISITSIQSINAIRGSLFGTLIFFGLGDFLAQKIFYFLIKK